MTPERKKYLDSISNEERVIRKAIAEEKKFISYSKDHINYYGENGAAYEMIAITKARIKALKKQLPVSMTYEIDELGIKWCKCLVCGVEDTDSGNYCWCCGQKLR